MSHPTADSLYKGSNLCSLCACTNQKKIKWKVATIVNGRNLQLTDLDLQNAIFAKASDGASVGFDARRRGQSTTIAAEGFYTIARSCFFRGFAVSKFDDSKCFSADGGFKCCSLEGIPQLQLRLTFLHQTCPTS